MSAYTLDDATLERAAEAHYNHYLRGFATKPDDPTIPTWRTRGPSPDAKRMFVEALRAALPVLAPALREQVVREMARDALNKKVYTDMIYVGVNPWPEEVDCTDVVVDYIRSYLPAAEERESGGAR